jgi:hypothetical protein
MEIGYRIITDTNRISKNAIPNNAHRSISKTALYKAFFLSPPGESTMLRLTPTTTAAAAIQSEERPAKAIPGYLVNTFWYKCLAVAK